jgi:thiamine kinase-like enzyme
MQIQVDALTFEEHLCHGDAHEGNLLVLRRTAYLLDWEDASLGPREWDLADVLLSHRRFGLSQQTLENFLLKYEESHSLDHSRFELMADLKELTATLWLLQNAEVDPLARTEVVGRIAAMRGVGDGAVWKTF